VDTLLRETLQAASSYSTPPFWQMSGAPFLIYGTGTVAQDVYRAFTASGIPITAFIDHLRTVVPSLSHVPVYRPDDTLLTPEARAHGTVILAIHNYEVDMTALIARLSSLGYRRTISMVDVYDHFADELGTRYWLTRRTFYESCEPMIESAYRLLADEPSRMWFSGILRFRITGDYSLLPPPDWGRQYGPPDIPPWHTPLRLVDCGAFDGDTLKRFLDAEVPIEAVAAFEPDASNFASLSQFIHQWPSAPHEAYLWPCAVHSTTGELRFDGGKGEASGVSAAGATVVQSVAIDDVLHGFRPNLIKLDIEGSECEALLGARHTIGSERPGLAVCVYHRPDHLWEIPLMLERLTNGTEAGPKYEYFLRGHAHSGFELVLYAVPVASRIS